MVWSKWNCGLLDDGRWPTKWKRAGWNVEYGDKRIVNRQHELEEGFQRIQGYNVDGASNV